MPFTRPQKRKTIPPTPPPSEGPRGITSIGIPGRQQQRTGGEIHEGSIMMTDDEFD